MTVFDALRWHISLPPTEEEMNKLPTELYTRWINHPHCGWNSIDKESSLNIKWVVNWMNNNWRPGHRGYDFLCNEVIKDVTLLRKLIMEWEPE